MKIPKESQTTIKRPSTGRSVGQATKLEMPKGFAKTGFGSTQRAITSAATKTFASAFDKRSKEKLRQMCEDMEPEDWEHHPGKRGDKIMQVLINMTSGKSLTESIRMGGMEPVKKQNSAILFVDDSQDLMDDTRHTTSTSNNKPYSPEAFSDAVSCPFLVIDGTYDAIEMEEPVERVKNYRRVFEKLKSTTHKYAIKRFDA
eukprot:TRINITY_DN2797_c0_g5_i5.p1 TRINITY_DN2797_c0_g5~~TRINITY_DN2797_c0_g5_i5.p1  ORF type:complete len:201 (-),score=22.95 TRINITY_DN2797_c0_g5_i5:152-754(-)